MSRNTEGVLFTLEIVDFIFSKKTPPFSLIQATKFYLCRKVAMSK